MNNFIILLEELGIKPTNEQLDQLRIYQEYLLEYNSHTNLTAITKKDEVYKILHLKLTILSLVLINLEDHLYQILYQNHFLRFHLLNL